MVSPRFTMNSEQLQSFLTALWKYALVPLLIVALTQLNAGKSLQEVLPYVYFAGLQLAINFLSKFVTETK